MTGGDLPADTRLGRVALTVADLDRQVEFYTDVVGLSVRERTDDCVGLGTNDGSLLEVSLSDALERADDETGLFHIAIRVPDRGALGAALERVEDKWRLSGASDHDVSEAIYLRDPEGNGLEISHDTPRDTWPELPDGRVDIGARPLDLAAIRAASDGRHVIPDGTDIGHVHLEVSSIPAAEKFYVDSLGFRLRSTWEGATGTEALFVAAGDYHHHLGLNTWNERTAPATGRGLAWVEVLVPDGVALEEVAMRLREHGVDVEPGTETLQVSDPGGIELRVRSQT